jgi:hypothetical protein
LLVGVRSTHSHCQLHTVLEGHFVDVDHGEGQLLGVVADGVGAERGVVEAAVTGLHKAGGRTSVSVDQIAVVALLPRSEETVAADGSRCKAVRAHLGEVSVAVAESSRQSPVERPVAAKAAAAESILAGQTGVVAGLAEQGPIVEVPQHTGAAGIDEIPHLRLIAERTGERILSGRAVLAGVVTLLAEIESGIGEIVVRTARNAGSVLVEVERVSARTDPRAFAQAVVGGEGGGGGGGVVIEVSDGIDGDAGAGDSEEIVAEEPLGVQIRDGGAVKLTAAVSLVEGQETIEVLSVGVLQQCGGVDQDGGDAEGLKGEATADGDSEAELRWGHQGGGGVEVDETVGGEEIGKHPRLQHQLGRRVVCARYGGFRVVEGHCLGTDAPLGCVSDRIACRNWLKFWVHCV